LLLYGAQAVAAAPVPPETDRHPSNELCLACHAQPDIVVREWPAPERRIDPVDPASFDSSAHNAMECVECHLLQSKLPHIEPDPLNRQESTDAVDCESCHEHSYETYLNSVHGTLVRFGDSRGPDCAACHGHPHDLEPMDERTADDLAQRCTQCHEGAGANFTKALSHEEPSASFIPTAYFAGRFLIILTATVLAFGIVYVELDLLRWLTRGRHQAPERKDEDGDARKAPPGSRDDS
jgi:hypothetical protein